MLTKNYRVILGIPSITFVSLLKFTRYNLVSWLIIPSINTKDTKEIPGIISEYIKDFWYPFYGYLGFLGMLFENSRVILGIQGIILVSLPMFTRYNLGILT